MLQNNVKTMQFFASINTATICCDKVIFHNLYTVCNLLPLIFFLRQPPGRTDGKELLRYPLFEYDRVAPYGEQKDFNTRLATMK